MSESFKRSSQRIEYHPAFDALALVLLDHFVSIPFSFQPRTINGCCFVCCPVFCPAGFRFFARVVDLIRFRLLLPIPSGIFRIPFAVRKFCWWSANG